MIFLLLICYILFLLLFLDPFREKQLSYLRTVKTEQRGGVVVDAGRVLDSSIRMSRCGTHVTIRLPDGVTMTYGRLASRIVKVGDRIREGTKSAWRATAAAERDTI